MFEKDKVKGHNRLVKTLKGLRVTRVNEFVRKEKKDNTKRNIVLGAAATGLGVGAVLLLKKKGINKTPFTKNLLTSAKSNTPKYPKGTTIRVKDLKTKSAVVTDKFDQLPDPWTTPIASRLGKRGTKLLAKKNISQNRIRPKDTRTVTDPWNSPIKSKLNNSDIVIKPNNKLTMKLLSPSSPNQRGNLTREKLLTQTAKGKVTSSIVNMRNTQRNYDSLPVEMKTIVQVEKALSRHKKLVV